MEYEYDVFISYSRKDTATADKICKALENNGISYFIDRQGIIAGMEFPDTLAKAILSSRIFLFLASKNSYRSKFTRNEVVFAFNKKEGSCVIPYIIDSSQLPTDLEFTFCSINWRNIKEHPIDSSLVQDIQKILNINKKSVEHQYEFIDLGLPSGLLWAKCNLGAFSPEEPGGFFAWGEIAAKDGFSSANYKALDFWGDRKQTIPLPLDTICDDTEKSSERGYLITHETLDKSCDAANEILGGGWRIPSVFEWKELKMCCDREWIPINGRCGYYIYSRINNNSIFIPAIGYRLGPRLLYGNEYGRYWSSTPNIENPNDAFCLNIGQHIFDIDSYYRYSGFTIRPVISKEDTFLCSTINRLNKTNSIISE